jgi:hypothetical protein
MQKLFDGPSEVAESCAARYNSTTALQALYLLNNPFVLARAKALAQRIEGACGSDRARQIDTAFRWTLGRPPDTDEKTAAEAFFAAPRAAESPSATNGTATGEVSRVLVEFCQSLLNLNEFVYLE